MTGDTTGPAGGDADTTSGRYVMLEVDDGGFLLYDRENPRGWIRAAETVPLENC